MHRERCFCERIVEHDLSTRLALVMHVRETQKTTATGPLALAALKNSVRYVHGVPENPLDLHHLFEENRRVLVLFPAPEARPLDEVARDDDDRPVTLVVPDGNWRQASRVPKRVAGLERAEAVTLPSGEGTRWGLRRETKAEGLATFEAIARAFGILESKEVQIELEKLFEHMVAESFAARGYDRDGTPENGAGVAQEGSSTQVTTLFEDEHLVAVNKPPGLLVHRGWGSDEHPRIQELSVRFGGKLFPVLELDRATSGLLLLARTEEMAEGLRRELSEGKLVYRFLALCHGAALESQRVEQALHVGKTERKRSATTDLYLLGAFEEFCLVEARPMSAVAHQIRRHLKFLNLPIAGDVRYGKGDTNRMVRSRFALRRLALHAHRLTLRHPMTGAQVSVEAPLGHELTEIFALAGAPG
jgi:23S rRNA-/tRNA-specific pseudouridylate synthase